MDTVISGMLTSKRAVFICLFLVISLIIILYRPGNVDTEQKKGILTVFSKLIVSRNKSSQSKQLIVQPQISQLVVTVRPKPKYKNSRKLTTASSVKESVALSKVLPINNVSSLNQKKPIINESILVTPAAEKLCGLTRLGNKLFMIAAAYTAAQRAGARFVLPECKWSNELQNTFPALQNFTLIPAKITDTWNNITEEKFTLYAPIAVTHNTSIEGYRQSWKYFNEASEVAQLQTLFKLNKPLVHSAEEVRNKLLDSIGARNATTIGVHIRLGDMLLSHNIKFGYRAANETFYREAFKMTLEYVKSQNKDDLVFLVASDSVDLAQKMLKPLNDIYKIVFTKQTDLIDFAILTLCDHSVISGGTYSFWSAFLAGGHVVYNDHYIEPGTKISNLGYDSRSFNPPEWHPL